MTRVAIEDSLALAIATMPDTLNHDAEYLESARYLNAAITFIAGQHQYSVGVCHGHVGSSTRGIPITGSDISFVGPDQQWARIIRGEHHLLQALNPWHGQLKIEGNRLLYAMNMSPFVRIFETFSKVHRHG